MGKSTFASSGTVTFGWVWTNMGELSFSSRTWKANWRWLDSSLNNSSNAWSNRPNSCTNHTTPPYLHCTCMETGTVLERGGTPESIALKSIGNDIKKRKLRKSPQNSYPKNSNLREERRRWFFKVITIIKIIMINKLTEKLGQSASLSPPSSSPLSSASWSRTWRWSWARAAPRGPPCRPPRSDRLQQRD